MARAVLRCTATMMSRALRGASWLEDAGRDISHAFRILASAPGFSSLVVVTLALGIGANTAIFTVVNSLLLRTLPVVEPDRLVVLAAGDSVARELRTWPQGIWEQIRLRSGIFDGIAASSMSQSLSLSTAGGESETVEGVFVSGDFFNTLGLSPLRGRTLTRDDDVRGGGREGPAAVISAGLWQRRFGASPDVVGAPIVIDRVPFTVVGVAPSAFLGTEIGRTFDVAVPIGTEPLLHGTASMIDNGGYWLRIIARLKREQSPSAATAILRSFQAQIASEAFPESLKVHREDFLKQPLVAMPAAAGVSRLRYEYTQPLIALLALAAVVLLIACANIANLLLTRAVHRRNELQVRLALGASRARIARHLFAESVVLGAGGGILGLVVAFSGSRALVSQLSTPMTRVALDLSFDWRVIAFISAVSLATVLLFGMAPAFRGMHLSSVDALKWHPVGNKRDANRSPVTLPKSLVIAQVALSVVLVIAAGLFVQTLSSLNAQDLGFDRDRILVVNIRAHRSGVEPGTRAALFEQASEAVRAVAGVAGASISLITPFNGLGYFAPEIRVSGASAPSGNAAAAQSYANIVAPGWFDAMGTPLLAGRDFSDDDRRGTRAVAIVNETWARTFVNGANPLGHSITIAYPYSGTPMDIVGLVADTALVWLRDPPPPTMYIPFSQFDAGPGSTGSVNLIVRSAGGPPALLTRSLTSALIGVNPDLDLAFRPLADQVNAALMQERLLAGLSTLFGALALMLAAVGTYGITVYGVTRRRHEIGIRMALGARRLDVLRLVLRHSAAVTTIGLALGIAGAAAVTRYLESMLFGLTPLDPATFFGVSLLFAAVAMVAAYIPARRAARADPLASLRCE